MDPTCPPVPPALGGGGEQCVVVECTLCVCPSQVGGYSPVFSAAVLPPEHL